MFTRLSNQLAIQHCSGACSFISIAEELSGFSKSACLKMWTPQSTRSSACLRASLAAAARHLLQAPLQWPARQSSPYLHAARGQSPLPHAVHIDRPLEPHPGHHSLLSKEGKACQWHIVMVSLPQLWLPRLQNEGGRCSFMGSPSFNSLDLCSSLFSWHDHPWTAHCLGNLAILHCLALEPLSMSNFLCFAAP